jgi:Fur family transcriptional regulator, stress-responsive regulator
MRTPSDFEGMLRGVALRVTRPRVAVLSAVHDQRTPTDSSIGVVRADLGEVSHQAVYDVLRALAAAGLVRRFQPTGLRGALRGAGRGQPPPRCVSVVRCHRRCRLRGPRHAVLTTPDDHGFTIDEAEVIYWGQCPECLARRLIADTQASTQQGYTLSPEQPNVTSKQPSGGNGEKGDGATCLTRTPRPRASAKAKTR